MDMVLPDWLQIKTIEKRIGRKLTDEEVNGKPVRIKSNGQVELVKIAKVHMLWLHKNNSCK